jgi:hypothetical protein
MLRLFFGSALILLLAAGCSRSASAPPEEPQLANVEAPVDLDALPGFTIGNCGQAGSGSSPSPCDPINLVFPGTGFAAVAGDLIAAGWSPLGIGSAEYVIEPGSSELLPAAVQLFETQGQGIAAARFHVRLWQLANGDTVGAVHHEGALAEHQIDLDWEAAEAEVVRALCTGGRVCGEGGVIEEQQRRQDGSERWRGFRNDWRPAVIRLT